MDEALPIAKQIAEAQEAATVGAYLPGGHLFYAQGNQRFLTVPFDLQGLSVTGPPTVISFFDDISISFAVGADGTLAYTRPSDDVQGLSTLAWEKWTPKSGQRLK